jgi:RHS repeat-associated protein
MPFDGLTSQPTFNHSLLAPGIVTAWPRPHKGGSGSDAIALSRVGGRVEPGGPERDGRKNNNNSNRLTRVYGATTQTSTITASKNRVASITDGTNTRHFTYSASGNMLTDDRVMNGAVAVSNTFGGRDRLESMTVGSPTITFKINAIGQRVQKAITGATTDYQFDLAGHIIGESNDSNAATIVEYVWMQGMMLAQIDSSGNIVYVHSDQVNNPQKVTNPSRTLVWDREQEPFGETYATPTNTTPTNHRFPGQYADAENLLSYNMMRDYDSTLGRYIESDPMGLNAGSNLYGYAFAEPSRYTDHLGLDVWVEGPSINGEEVSGHESINVGDPNGDYHSYSFGVMGPHLWNGEVYSDIDLGGPFVEGYYLATTPEEDSLVQRLLDSQLTKKGFYGGVVSNCETFSERQFNDIKNMGIGRPMSPIPRDTLPSTPNANGPSSPTVTHEAQ